LNGWKKHIAIHHLRFLVGELVVAIVIFMAILKIGGNTKAGIIASHAVVLTFLLTCEFIRQFELSLFRPLVSSTKYFLPLALLWRFVKEGTSLGLAPGGKLSVWVNRGRPALRAPRVNDEHTIPKIAVFTGAYTHVVDSTTLTLNRLVAKLDKDHISVMVFAPTVEDPPIEHAGTLVPAASFAPWGNRKEYRISLGLSRKAVKRLKHFQPTIFHIATPDIVGLQALLLAKRWSIPVVASYHTHFSSYLKYYGMSKMETSMWAYVRWFYDRCQFVYAPTTSMIKVLNDEGIVNTRLWSRGVDVATFDAGFRSSKWRESLEIEEHEVVILIACRLVWEKGLNTFAETVEKLKKDGIHHRSVVVGEGPARSELERRLTSTIFLGQLDTHDLAISYASSDIFLFPSSTETFGNAVLEAQASGMACVCANAPGGSAMIQHYETGLLAPPDDTPMFSYHTRNLILNPALRQRLGKNALIMAQSRSWEEVLGEVVASYRSALTQYHEVAKLDRPVQSEFSSHRVARDQSLVHVKMEKQSKTTFSELFSAFFAVKTILIMAMTSAKNKS